MRGENRQPKLGVPKSIFPATVNSLINEKMVGLQLDNPNREHTEQQLQSPLISLYNDRIRPLLDAVDRLRHLNVMKEGIELPTIVVVGDQSSGKSSVLESLAGINLPRGQGICTRVPLIMRLQDVSTDKPLLQLEYKGKIVPTSENNVSDAINVATDEIAGNEKGISDTPLTLVVRKKAVPDLTMIDLPGITRVPVHGQPENIYEQISSIIMQYIKPKESIILNVLSATVDFPTCESIRMSQLVDKTGERTLAVVTKSDKCPEGLLEKVTADDVNISLGYVCVRNRIGNESYEDARIEEARLFESHPLLSKIHKSMTGIPVLAQKLVHIQATIISQCLPDIVKKINDKLNKNVSDLNSMPKNLVTIEDAMQAFMRIVSSSKEAIKKLLLRGEFDDFPDDAKMHCTARAAKMLDQFVAEIKSQSIDDNDTVPSKQFLMAEINVLQEAKRIGLANFLPRTAFVTLLQRKVERIALSPVNFVVIVWEYIEDIVIRIFSQQSEEYLHLQSLIKRAVHNLMDKKRDSSVKHAKELIDIEKIAAYTSNPNYLQEWSDLMKNQEQFMVPIKLHSKPTFVNLFGFGSVEVGHLRNVSLSMVEQAFDVKMRLTAYWKIVILRLVDSLALHLLFSFQNLVDRELEGEIVNELMCSNRGVGIERMLEESPSVAMKRERLNKSIQLLRESKNVVANIMDRFDASDGRID